MLRKTDAVLRALERRHVLSASELAQEVGEPVSSTYRLLASLAALRLVEPGPRRGQYRLGVEVLRIGAAVEEGLDVRELAVPELKDLLATTDATSFLCVRVQERAVCVERFEGRGVRSLALTLGQSLPLHRGAAPRSLLAHLPQSERRAVIDALLDTDGTAASVDDIEKDLEVIRQRGYAISDGDVTPGIAAVGAPIFDHRGELRGALSISGLREQVLDARLDAAMKVRAAAERVSTALGHRGMAS